MRLKRARGRDRNRSASRWRRLLRHRVALAFGAASICIIVGGAALAWHAEAIGRFADRGVEAALGWTGRAGLSVDEILVEGRQRVAADELRAAIGVALGVPILAVDLDDVRERIEALGWVKRASVARHLPDVLRIAVIEREPMALWQHNDLFAVIGQDGEVITRDRVGAFVQLPQVVGADAAEHAAELLRMVRAAPRVAERFDTAVRVSGRRWNLRLDNDVVVKLPADGAAHALLRADRAQSTDELFDRDIVAVDMRVPDRMFVRLKDAEAVLARDQD